MLNWFKKKEEEKSDDPEVVPEEDIEKSSVEEDAPIVEAAAEVVDAESIIEKAAAPGEKFAEMFELDGAPAMEDCIVRATMEKHDCIIFKLKGSNKKIKVMKG